MKKIYTGFSKVNNMEKYNHVKTKLKTHNGSNHIPFITVVIPTYNRAELLKDSIDSVLSQKQFSDFEIIVIDNEEKTDTKTEMLLKTYNDNRIFYYKNDMNIGQIGNWNRGILLAKSEWVVLLHDDDYLKPLFLKKTTDCLKANATIEGIFSVPISEYIKVDETEIGKRCEIMRNEKEEVSHSKTSINNKLHLFKNKVMLRRQRQKEQYLGEISKLEFKDYYFDCGIFAPTGGVYKRKNVLELGGFSEEAFPLSDWDFHLRYINKFNLYVLFEELIVTRMGVNDSMKKDIRIGFVEKGYLIRNEMRKQFNTIFGEWWIQIECWRHAIGFHKLEIKDLDNIPLNPLYNKNFFKYIYFAVIYYYSKHMKFYVPLFESRDIDNC